jgi:hypothetical protein
MRLNRSHQALREYGQFEDKYAAPLCEFDSVVNLRV